MNWPGLADSISSAAQNWARFGNCMGFLKLLLTKSQPAWWPRQQVD